MQFELKNPIQVYSKDDGNYVDESTVVVSFKGKKGLRAIKKLQDIIFKSFQSVSTQGNDEAKKQLEDKEITINEVFDLLEMMGTSEKLFDEVTKSLSEFATIGGQRLTEKLQDEMELDDLDELYKEVLKTFLLPKVTQKMNSMKS